MSTPDTSFRFGDFNYACSMVSLTLCPLVGQSDGVEPVCYSRNVRLVDTLIFQPSTLIIHIIALIMTAIMIYHIRSKYTAVGRKEIIMFFYLYILVTIMDLLLISGIIPTASSLYPYFTGVHLGLISATFWCLLLNGFVGFQFAEDGTPLSLWSIRISSFVVFAAVTFLSIATFKDLGPFKREAPIALWIVFFIFNGAAFLIYVILQIVLVVNTLDDRWPLGDIMFGVLFFATGQVILYVFSVDICNFAKHYIDGLFFGTIATLLSVMMVYKYWDSITKEDLEFSVGSKQNVWEVKELLGEDEMAGGGLYGQPGGGPGSQHGGYGGFNGGAHSPAAGPYGQPNYFEERY
ncbi:Chitin synthase, class 7 [Actinomortierella ambigua]|uniref:Chitin synthase export chaperone n=1 Tax=Actinomortierella ambigua TaxID=1343610 RepID=A0A9P6QCL9_9FUNG|nr:Chitin synthase, class 7 [Actinomortierella ambigua]KAG0263299.1 Chitin synthase, class 7 [Actinomortierella ambigua]